MRRKRWLLILVVVLALGLGYAGYSLLTGTGADSLTVSDLKARAGSLNGPHLMVEGKVAPGSINWDEKTNVIKFTLTDNVERVEIIYQGVVPDTFKPGVDLVVVGKYRQDNVFEAVSLARPGSLCNTCH